MSIQAHPLSFADQAFQNQKKKTKREFCIIRRCAILQTACLFFSFYLTSVV